MREIKKISMKDPYIYILCRLAELNDKLDIVKEYGEAVWKHRADLINLDMKLFEELKELFEKAYQLRMRKYDFENRIRIEGTNIMMFIEHPEHVIKRIDETLREAEEIERRLRELLTIAKIITE